MVLHSAAKRNEESMMVVATTLYSRRTQAGSSAERDVKIEGKYVYSLAQRVLHWLTAVMLVVTIAIALIMTGSFGKVSHAMRGFLYDSHKLIGVVIFFLVILRLVFRATRGAPPSEPTLETWQRLVSEATHWAMYAFLILVPIGGYVALQYYGPIKLFNVLPLPSFVTPDLPISGQLFMLHKLAAFALIGLVCAHFAAAMFHRFIVKDNVLGRMWPSQLQRPRQSFNASNTDGKVR
jgi:cytochrome b561